MYPRRAAALLMTAISLVGCGRAAPNRLPTGQRVTVSPGKVELSTDRFTTTQQPGAAVPSSFPKDIPIYPGAIHRIHSSDNGQVFSMTMDVPGGVASQIEAYYRDHFAKAGWIITLDHRGQDGGAMIQFRSATRSCRVTVGTTDEGTTALGFFISDRGTDSAPQPRLQIVPDRPIGPKRRPAARATQ